MHASRTIERRQSARKIRLRQCAPSTDSPRVVTFVVAARAPTTAQLNDDRRVLNMFFDWTEREKTAFRLWSLLICIQLRDGRIRVAWDFVSDKRPCI